MSWGIQRGFGNMKRGRDKEKKEEEKNPLHVEYGVLRNVRYILKNMVRADSHILPIIVMGVVLSLIHI